MNAELEYLKKLAGITTPKTEVHIESNEEVLEEGTVSNIDFEKVTELFNKSKSSTWTNSSSKGLRFDKGYVEVMEKVKLRTIDPSTLSSATHKYFLKLINANIKGESDLSRKFKAGEIVYMGFFLQNFQVFLLVFNPDKKDSSSQQDTTTLFNMKPDNFKARALESGYKIVPDKTLKYSLVDMSYSEEREQLEITLKENIMITHNNYGKTKAGTPDNTLTIRKSGSGIGLFANFYTTFEKTAPAEDVKSLSAWCKTHITGFKIMEFRELVKSSFGDVYENFDKSNSIDQAISLLKAEVDGLSYEIKNGVVYASVKRWSKVNFEFDMDNVTSADWTISRKITPKSAEFLDTFVAKLESKLKKLVEIRWDTSEKWHTDFIIKKA